MTGATSWGPAEAGAALRRPVAADDKYARGVVGLRTGSQAYPGAAVLGVEAAWRTGVGMVRYLGPDRAADLVLARRPETVPADGRVQAWVIGSGTDAAARAEAETGMLRRLLAGDLPVVVDAGALELAVGARAPLVVTPHAREHERLRATLGLGGAVALDEDARAAAARETAAALGAVVLLKGAVTLVASPDGRLLRIASGTPWLATAGTGDVLAGAIGAVVAAAQAAAERDGGTADLAASAATGAWLHGRAGALASGAHGRHGAPIVALDVAAALPRAVAEALDAVPSTGSWDGPAWDPGLVPPRME